MTGDDLRPPVEPASLLQHHLDDVCLGDAVGLLTSGDIRAFVDRTVAGEAVTARCVATVGLSNALRAGDSPGAFAPVGTINIVCHVSQPLTPEAMVEAIALASEARALAVREADVPSRRSGDPASGTGTDCIVVACPDGDPSVGYAGKHTEVGHVVGAAVYAAIRDGVAAWRQRNASGFPDEGDAHA